MFKFCAILLTLCSCYDNSHGANILAIFNYPSYSHNILADPLMEALIKQGHKITMLTPFVKNQTYEVIELKDVLRYKNENMKAHIQGAVKKAAISNFKMFQVMSEICYKDKAVRDLLKSDRKFDLIIQFWIINEAFLGLSHHFNAPVVAFLPMGGMWYMDILSGNTSPASYVPTTMSTFTHNMTFFERLKNSIAQIAYHVTYWYEFFPYQEKMLKKHFPNAPPLSELLDNLALVLVNSHFSMESPRPYVPNMVQIGGFHIQEPQELGTDLKTYLDKAKRGVVYLNFGSNIKIAEMPKERLNALFRVFKKLDFEVLLKFEVDQMPIKLDNVKISKWLPQRGVLAHPNVKAFITHGGFGSITESIYFGVPMVCIPFFGDQHKNCDDIVTRHFGVQIQLESLNEDILSKSLNEVLYNTQYRETIQFSSDLIQNQPVKPLNNAVFWIEHVLKHKGAKHLRPFSTKLRWYQYLLLDVAAFILGTLVVILLLLYVLIKFIIKLNGKKTKSVKKEKSETKKKVK